MRRRPVASLVGPASQAPRKTRTPKAIAEAATVTRSEVPIPRPLRRRAWPPRWGQGVDHLGPGEAAQHQRQDAGGDEAEAGRTQRRAGAARPGRSPARRGSAPAGSARSASPGSPWRRSGRGRADRTRGSSPAGVGRNLGGEASPTPTVADWVSSALRSSVTSPPSVETVVPPPSRTSAATRGRRGWLPPKRLHLGSARAFSATCGASWLRPPAAGPASAAVGRQRPSSSAWTSTLANSWAAR